MNENEDHRGQFPGSDLRAEEEERDEDLGVPIAELREIDEEVSPGFIGKVLSKLQRRSLVGHFATMVWAASALALFEFLRMMFSIFDHGNPPKKEGRTDG